MNYFSVDLTHDSINNSLQIIEMPLVMVKQACGL